MTRSAFTAEDRALTMNFPGFVFRSLRAQGFAEQPLLDGTGLKAAVFADPDFRCAFWQHRRLMLNAMAATQDPHLGPRLALDFDPNSLGLPFYAAMSSDRFTDALEVLRRTIFLTIPIVAFEHEISGDEVVIHWRPTLVLGEIEYFVLKSTLATTATMFRRLLRRDQVLLRAEFTASPSGEGAAPAPHLGFPVAFGAAQSRAFFPRPLLDAPIPSADPLNHKRLLTLCAQMAERSEFKTGFGAQVTAYLSEGQNHEASLAQTAAAFGYSERSFRRRLEQSGASYRKLVDQVREERARALLANTMRSIQSIAYELGFNEPSNFARTFKRWTGASPKEFRDGERPARGSGQN